jgi:Uncharacterised nucleotidyltransferase
VTLPEIPIPAPTSPEARLVVCCAAYAPDDERAALARELLPLVDLDLLSRLARHHGVTPAVYQFLDQNCAELMPEVGAAALRTRFQIVVLFNRHLAGELVRLVRMFTDAGIEVISFKGPVLAFSAYGSIEARQFVDLDLLIERSDLPRAAELLASQGYASILKRRERAGDPYFQEFEDYFAAPGGVGGIDLHWRMTPRSFPFAPDEDSLRRRAVTVDLNDCAIRTLEPLDHLLYVCVHAAKHGWHKLSSISDVAAIVRANPEIDLHDALARASQCGSRRMLLTGLYLAHALLGAPLPDDVFAVAASDPQIVSLCAKVAKDLFRHAPGVDQPIDPWMVPLRSIEAPAARARYVVHRLLAPTMGDYQMLPLPDALFPLYWLMRPFRMAVQYGPRLVRGAIGGHAASEEAGSR